MGDDLKPGAVVALASGGPKMTLDHWTGYSAGSKAVCIWFDGSERRAGEFHVAALRPAETE